jgi:hypothetical protein
MDNLEDIMTQQAEHTIMTVTQNHTIEVTNGHLTIRGEQETLTPDETEQLLDALMIWRYGLEEFSIDDWEI